MRQMLNRDRRVAQSHELDESGEEQRHAPRAERADDEHRLRGQPQRIAQGRRTAQPGAESKPARLRHFRQANDGHRDENRLGGNTEECVGNAEFA